MYLEIIWCIKYYLLKHMAQFSLSLLRTKCMGTTSPNLWSCYEPLILVLVIRPSILKDFREINISFSVIRKHLWFGYVDSLNEKILQVFAG